MSLPEPFRGVQLVGFPIAASSSQIRQPVSAITFGAFGAGGSRGNHPQQWTLSLNQLKPLLPQMDSRKLALLCRRMAENRKAEEIVIGMCEKLLVSN